MKQNWTAQQQPQKYIFGEKKIEALEENNTLVTVATNATRNIVQVEEEWFQLNFNLF